MTFISLAEFQQLAGISDRALIILLSSNMLSCEYNPEKGVMVDVDACEVQQLVCAVGSRQKELFPNRKKILVEQFAKIISNSLDCVLNEAIASILSEDTISRKAITKDAD
ncbi:hypothetical protein OAO01_01805 [Oligoflexia bacterium]|nr:hypothetical protein [Oligoflexia bacterium]